MEISVVNTSGKDTGKKVALAESVFGIEPNDHAIYLDVKQYLANQRQGTHKSKERAEIAGSTRKIKRQKGTGTARAGSLKSPVFRGGGRVFGPRPRNYSFKLNKKLKVLARKSALTYKAQENNIVVVDNVDFKEVKTKAFTQLLKSLSIDTNSLFVVGDANKNAYLSSKNIPNVKLITVSDLNTYAVLRADKVVMTEDALAKVLEN